MVWVRSDCPYKIVHKLSELQTLLKRGASMPESFFNLGVRFLAYREAKGMKWHNKKVVKHNMDLRFCVSYIFMIKVSHTHILSICKHFDQIDLAVLHIS
jgi:predicted nucleic acid-binding protein